MCCCKRKPTSDGSNSENRRGFLGMFAKLDEFESLTPLIVTPASSTPSASKLASPSPGFEVPPTRLVPTAKETFVSHRHLRPVPITRNTLRIDSSIDLPPRQTILVTTPPIVQSSDSPPPPRKNLTGKTQIVPLGPNNNRLTRAPLTQFQFAPLLGTPDSRVTSFEAGTTKSCATIPEDDELALDDEEPEQTVESIDLISIDRTYGSVPATQYIHSASAYHIQVPTNVPEFKIPTPAYSPPAPPRSSTTGRSPASTKRSFPNNNRMHDSPNLSSPEGSSCGLESPIETTGSLSDSFLMPSESDTDKVCYIDAEHRKHERVVISEIESVNSEAPRPLPPLQRIEEESEQGSFVYSTAGSGRQSLDPGKNFIPRSISQQLELMHNEKERRKSKDGK